MANQNTDKRRPVTWDGVEYDSISELARAKGVTRQRVHQWIERGYTGDADIKGVGRPSKRAEYQAAYRAVRMLDHDRAASVDTSDIPFAMLWLAHQSLTPTWREGVTLRLHLSGKQHTTDAARLIAHCYYHAGL